MNKRINHFIYRFRQFLLLKIRKLDFSGQKAKNNNSKLLLNIDQFCSDDPLKNHFSGSERNLGFLSDNQISYFAGPIVVDLDLIDHLILLETDTVYEPLLKESLLVAIEIWKLEISQVQIIRHPLKIQMKIPYLLHNLELYLDYSLIYF